MYYLKTIPDKFLKPKVSSSLLKNAETSPINAWPFISFLNSLKINKKIPRKTNPLLLFVNLLMKHGKKTSALRVLSMTLYLFKAKISKIKLEKRGKQKTVNLKEFNNYGFWRNTYTKAFITQYCIKPINFTGILSSQKGISLRATVKNMPLTKSKKLTKGKALSSIEALALLGLPFQGSPKGTPFWGKGQHGQAEQGHVLSTLGKGSANILQGQQLITSLKSIDANISADKTQYSFFPELYRKVFPFFYNFGFLQDFYISKNYLRGLPFLNLKNYKIQLNKNYTFRKPVTTNSEKYNSLTKTLLNSKTSVETKTKNFKKCLFCKKNLKNDISWYKNFEKNPSWDFLTSPQKTTFLYCLYKAISNVKPPLECRTKRIGGSNKQIPGQISEHRQWGIAIRWIIEAAKNFSKKKSENNEKGYKPVAPSHNNLQSSGTKDELNYPRRGFFDKTMTSLLQKTIEGAPLKGQISKTRSYRFCFFLADSLENAYYKKGPAMQKRNLWIEAALTHRAFLRYRWW